mmetsp:Transcript_20590/g.58358  ORF Transcript_20590/g.58358 Transcript_20590/m.58358 type:complete len:309 (+) Transcript_20590:1170-2096(+)
MYRVASGVDRVSTNTSSRVDTARSAIVTSNRRSLASIARSTLAVDMEGTDGFIIVAGRMPACIASSIRPVSIFFVLFFFLFFLLFFTGFFFIRVFLVFFRTTFDPHGFVVVLVLDISSCRRGSNALFLFRGGSSRRSGLVHVHLELLDHTMEHGKLFLTFIEFLSQSSILFFLGCQRCHILDTTAFFPNFLMTNNVFKGLECVRDGSGERRLCMSAIGGAALLDHTNTNASASTCGGRSRRRYRARHDLLLLLLKLLCLFVFFLDLFQEFPDLILGYIWRLHVPSVNAIVIVLFFVFTQVDILSIQTP